MLVIRNSIHWSKLFGLTGLTVYLAFISNFAQELSSIGNELRKRIETEKREIERLNVRIFRFDFR